MRSHRNARTTWRSRLLIVERVEQGWSVSAVAQAAGVSRTTVYRWLGRHAAEGVAGLQDRSSAPHRVWNRTEAAVVRRIAQLRRGRMRATQIAELLRMALSTVSGILRRLGLSRARDIEEREPVVRYERERPGELLHLDTKKLGRFGRPGKRVTRDRGHVNPGAGWEYVHVCVDDHSRVAYVEVLAGQNKAACTGFLQRAAAWYAARGVRVERVMTDNAKAYGSGVFQSLLKDLGARHVLTRPYRPQTNGKAERFIQTLLREWAYARPYESAAARARALGPWLERYNHRRPHRGIGGKTPITRLPTGV